MIEYISTQNVINHNPNKVVTKYLKFHFTQIQGNRHSKTDNLFLNVVVYTIYDSKTAINSTINISQPS